MRPRKQEQTQNEDQIRLERAQETGIFDWQELAHLDFQDLIELARNNDSESEEAELNLDE